MQPSGKGGKGYYIWSRTHDEDGHYAHIWQNP